MTEVPVTSQESEGSNICVLGVSILLLFLHFRLGFEIIATELEFSFYVHVDIIMKDKKSTLRKSIIQLTLIVSNSVDSNFYRSPELRCV